MSSVFTRRSLIKTLNENAFGPSPNAASAIQLELPRLSRYADARAAQAFGEPPAAPFRWRFELC
jgi:histidinol-phosphate/aromatic aminotransferase/cobyric acid decarboxylase-like protein